MLAKKGGEVVDELDVGQDREETHGQENALGNAS